MSSLPQFLDEAAWAFTPLAAIWGWAFLSTFSRILGLLALSRLFGPWGASIGMRVVLAGSLAFVVSPSLVIQEIIRLPVDGWDAAVHLGSEFTIGALLGLGVQMVFAGLRLAGELADQQAGAAVHEVFDPQSGETATPSAQLLTLVGTLAFLSIVPGNGHVLIVGTLLNSFTQVPSDLIWTGTGAIGWLCRLGQASLTLGLQFAAPFVAAGAVVSWSVSMLSGSTGSPYATTLLGVPLRIVVSLGILTMCLSGGMELLLLSLGDVMHRFSVLVSGG